MVEGIALPRILGADRVRGEDACRHQHGVRSLSWHDGWGVTADRFHARPRDHRAFAIGPPKTTLIDYSRVNGEGNNVVHRTT